jgi:hypothetical protein
MQRSQLRKLGAATITAIAASAAVSTLAFGQAAGGAAAGGGQAAGAGASAGTGAAAPSAPAAGTGAATPGAAPSTGVNPGAGVNTRQNDGRGQPNLGTSGNAGARGVNPGTGVNTVPRTGTNPKVGAGAGANTRQGARPRTTNRVGTDADARTDARTRSGLSDERIQNRTNTTNRSGATARQNTQTQPQGNRPIRRGEDPDNFPEDPGIIGAPGPKAQFQNNATAGSQPGVVNDDGIVQDGVLKQQLNQIGFQIGMEEGNLSVDKLTNSSLAAEAGLKRGDVITSINGQDITSSVDLAAAFAGLQPGETLTLTVDRNGTPHQLTMTMPDDFQTGRGPDGRPIPRAFGQAGQPTAGGSAAQIQSLRDELQALREELQALRGQ